ncbi:MAG: hypothetical protein GWP59_04315 [Chlamydiales bacterium]|nr:hypothetical protein [Chlamydiales bacterium]NCF70908.1 hypothetical protein [Chlamydiales bacterium]
MSIHTDNDLVANESSSVNPKSDYLTKDEQILYGSDPLLRANMNMYRMLESMQTEKASELNVKVKDAGSLRTLKSALEDAKSANQNFSVSNPQIAKLLETADRMGITIPYKTDAEGERELDSDGNEYLSLASLEAFTKQVGTLIKNTGEVTKMEQMNLQMIMNQASASLNIAVAHRRNQKENFDQIMQMTRR